MHKDTSHTVSGSVSGTVDDLLIPATDTVGIAASVAEQAMVRWGPDDVRPYDPGFLAGHQAALPAFDIRDARARAQAYVEEGFQGMARQDSARHITRPGQHVRIFKSDPIVRDVTAKLILVPFWLGHYMQAGTARWIAVDGHGGRAAAEHPGHGHMPWLFAAGIVAALMLYLYAKVEGPSP